MRVHFKGERGIESTFSEGLLIKGGSETFKICFFLGGVGQGAGGLGKKGWGQNFRVGPGGNYVDNFGDPGS